jgi:hypothetical protein
VLLPFHEDHIEDSLKSVDVFNWFPFAVSSLIVVGENEIALTKAIVRLPALVGKDLCFCISAVVGNS